MEYDEFEEQLWEWASDTKDLIYALIEIAEGVRDAKTLEDVHKVLDSTGMLEGWRELKPYGQ